MAIVRLDQKMRLRIPKGIRLALRLKKGDALEIVLKNGGMSVGKPSKKDFSNDPVLRDMVERPMRSNVKVTSALLDRWKDEMWNP